MALLNKLKEVHTVKQNYFVLQRRFYAELSKRYPYIMNCDVAKITNKLENELTILLCTALKYKSVKIPLTASRRYYSSSNDKTYVNVQRGEPGFYYPQSQRGYTDIYYMRLEQYIDDKGNMRMTSEETQYDNYGNYTGKGRIEDKLLVELSQLKSPDNAARMVPANLDAYFKFLKEVMAYRKKFLCYTDEGYTHNIGAKFLLGGLKFELRPKSMNILIPGVTDSQDAEGYKTVSYDNEDPELFKHSPTKNDILRLLDYSGDDGRHFSQDVHNRFKLFIENYEAIIARLDIEEAKKKKAYETCKSFVKQMRVYTLPFKVLKEIQT